MISRSLTALALSGLVLFAQEQRPVFRSGTALVPITVSVTDQQGRAVTGLTQADFRIFEDGVPREVAAFHPQMLTPGRAVDPEMAIARASEGGLAPATRRSFVIIPAFGRIQEPTGAFDGALKFIREHLLPQDAVALMVAHRTTALTTDHRAIEQVLARYKKEHPRIIMDVRGYLASVRGPGVCGAPPIPPEMLAGIDRDLFDGILPSASRRSTLDLMFTVGVGSKTGEKPWQRQQTFGDIVRQIEPCYNVSDLVVTSTLLKLYAAIEYLRHLDGEKHAIVMGGSISGDADRAKVVAARANDARVIVNYVSTSGMMVTPNARHAFSGCAPCRDVAERTGGSYTSVDSMAKALARVDERSRSSYLLGYTPVNPTFDGRYRRIRVEVTRPGLTVTHRFGYNATEKPGSLSIDQMIQEARTAEAGAYGSSATDIGVSVAVRGVKESASPSAARTVTVDVTVDMSTIALESAGGVRTGELDVTVYVGDTREKVIGQTQSRWNLRPDEATYTAWLTSGLTRTISVPATSRPGFVKVIVYDRQSDRLGSKSVKLR